MAPQIRRPRFPHGKPGPKPRKTTTKSVPVRRSARLALQPVSNNPLLLTTGETILISDTSTESSFSSHSSSFMRALFTPSPPRTNASPASSAEGSANSDANSSPVAHSPPPPPPASHCPEVIPSAWFHSSLAKAKFLSTLVNRPVHACERVDLDSFRTENLGFVDYLIQSQCGPLLNLTDEYYPQLVRMFYANVRTNKVGPMLSLSCQVKYTSFTLTESTLNQIFGLPTVSQPTLSQLEARNRCLAEFALPQHRAHTSHLSSFILQQDPRLLYYIIVRTFLPKPNSTDYVNHKTLEAIYLLMTGQPLNFSRYILQSMAKVSSVQRPAPLPYANLLTRIVQHFGVSFDNEVRESRSVPVITPLSLKTIQFFKTESGLWKFIEDMTPIEKQAVSLHFSAHVKPRYGTPSSAPPPCVNDHLLALDERLHELQEAIDKIEYTVVQHTDSIDGLAHNQADIASRLTRIDSSITKHFAEVNKKLDALLHIDTVIRQCALKGVPLTSAERASSSSHASQIISLAHKIGFTQP